MKQKLVFYTFFIIIFLLLQTTLLGYARVYDVAPNLLVVLVIVAAFMRGSVEGAAVGLFAGFAMDMMFGRTLGFYALLGIYLGVAAGSVNKRLFRENLLVVLFFTFIYSVAYEYAVYVLSTVMSGNLKLLYPMAAVILPEAVYNCVAAVFIYPLLLWSDKRIAESAKAARKY